jgi:hypothetical protein
MTPMVPAAIFAAVEHAAPSTSQEWRARARDGRRR